jgi:hypothetical protein
MQGKTVPVLHTVFCAIILATYFALILPLSKPFPWTDDWTYVEILGSSGGDMLRWLWAQHNDHRIPFMKAMQLTALRLSGFDFRSLLVLNALLALCGTLAMFQVARRFRGYSHIGDLIIPMILLNFGFGLFGWGFSAAFLISVAANMIFLFLFGLAIERNSRVLEALSFFFLFVCALTAMNGLVVASIVSAAIFAAGFLQRPSAQSSVVRYASLVILLTCIVLLVSWKPSEASVSVFSVPPSQVADWAFQLSKSSFVISAFTGGWWRSAIVVGLTLAAAAIAFGRIKRDRRESSVDFFRVAVYSSFFGYIALGVSLVAGRSAHSAWHPGLEMHYGYLASPIPIFAWLIVSSSAKPALSGVLAMVLLVLYGDAFVANARWRLAYTWSAAGRFAEIAQLIRSDAPPASITQKYMLELFYVDAPNQRQRVEAGIVKLRSYGGPLYGKVP